jgi:hemolysin D
MSSDAAEPTPPSWRGRLSLNRLSFGRLSFGRLSLDQLSLARLGFERRPADELEFLPAALEIVETPASPAGRITMLTITGLITIALLWACFGKVDIIATATGRIIPSGKEKLVQPFEIGVVRAIHVGDGDHVKAGDVLIELDPTTNAADQERIARDLVQAELDSARLTAALAGDPDKFKPPADAAAPLVEAAHRQLMAQLAEHQAKVESLDGQIAAKTAEREAAKAAIAKVAASLPLAQQKAELFEKLRANEYSSKVAALAAEQELVEAQHNGALAREQLAAAEASIDSLTQERGQAEAEFRRQALEDLAKAEQKAAEERQEQVKATERTELQTLKSSVDGTVEQLSVHTVGGVVTPAQALMVIVPDGSGLEVEAMLPNREVGFVHSGQPAEVKVEAFTYTRYGLLHGHVDGVSRDALRTDRDQPGTDRNGASGEQRDAGRTESSAYVARVSLGETVVQTELGALPLEPGMAVTAEIKTGRRRVIDYLLSPLLRYHHEGLRER